VDWAAFDLTVAGDCQHRRDAFVAWARAVSRLANPAAVLHRNTDKRCLGPPVAAGLPAVPRRFLAPGAPFAV
jgi:hypothetical protein